MRKRRRYSKSILNFNKEQYVPKELEDIFTLWILRALFDLNAHSEFLDKDNYFVEEHIAQFLDLEEFIDIDTDSFKREDVLSILRAKYLKLEKRKRFSCNKLLTKNIKQLSNLMTLNTYEEEILKFSILLHQYEILDDSMRFLGNELNTQQVYRMCSVILDIPLLEVKKVFRHDSKFVRSSILTIYKRNTNDLKRQLDPISDSFFDNMLNMDADISVMLKESISLSSESTLKLSDYTHIQKEIDILVPYLKNSIENYTHGVNILLYGLPGTGKTELSKTLAKVLKTKLYEVSCLDEDDEPIDGKSRLKSYKTAQALLSNEKTLLMYDEAEDIFVNSGGIFAPVSRQKDKAWINKVLESNTIPTIWITNNINSIDSAIVRRFDLSIEIPIPNKSKRIEIIKQYSNNLLDNKTINILAENEDIAPALISRATKVTNSINANNSAELFTHILNGTLKAQGHNTIKESILCSSLPSTYNPSYVNCNMDLLELVDGIKENQNARICLYGVAGTGKSAYGKYIAESLNKKVILKKASDLQSKWVGECEKNIANAFKEASEEKAILVFDEVDSFLQDRTNAKASWEISQVNEMLVQMENFDGIFIATTNLMYNLDSASLRRFDLKLEFSYLKSTQAFDLFDANAKELKLDDVSSEERKIIENLDYLTPGDFAAVLRQNKFRPIKTISDFIRRLEDEVSVKRVSTSNKMGFI
jgi:SpoVK/Ycf46/Vps4 family AAA+-type ATPase